MVRVLMEAGLDHRSPIPVRSRAARRAWAAGFRERHVHLFFDTDTDSADYDVVYGNTAQVTRELAPGEHTNIASLRDPDHGDAGPSTTAPESMSCSSQSLGRLPTQRSTR